MRWMSELIPIIIVGVWKTSFLVQVNENEINIRWTTAIRNTDLPTTYRIVIIL